MNALRELKFVAAAMREGDDVPTPSAPARQRSADKFDGRSAAEQRARTRAAIDARTKARAELKKKIGFVGMQHVAEAMARRASSPSKR